MRAPHGEVMSMSTGTMTREGSTQTGAGSTGSQASRRIGRPILCQYQTLASRHIGHPILASTHTSVQSSRSTPSMAHHGARRRTTCSAGAKEHSARKFHLMEEVVSARMAGARRQQSQAENMTPAIGQKEWSSQEHGQ